MKKLGLAAFLGVVASVTACGSASEAATDTVDAVDETRTTSLHGTWTAAGGETRPATVTVEQSALSARLIVALDGHVCLAESVVEAKVTMDGVKTTADVAGMHLELDGSPGLEEVLGNFDAIEGGPCPGQGGWMSVRR